MLRVSKTVRVCTAQRQAQVRQSTVTDLISYPKPKAAAAEPQVRQAAVLQVLQVQAVQAP